MNNRADDIKILFTNYSNGTASRDEARKLLELLEGGEYDDQVIAHMQQQMACAEPLDSLDTVRLENLLSDVQRNIKAEIVVRRLWPSIAVTAAIFLVIFGAGLFYFNYEQQKHHAAGTDYEISPGKVGATLTLNNGKKIRLDAANSGKLARESGVEISKSADGKLVYQVIGDDTGINQPNTLTTAKGETYQVRLPDGTNVWLNAASSLTYMTRPDEQGLRRVRLEGEAYFEVAKDKKHPFVVESSGQNVYVLGTHFNVKNYADEPAVLTTLLEGSVKVASGANVKTITPGEQAISSGNAIRVSAVNVNDVVAWKNGNFQFSDENIQTVMLAISRWYDVDVVYQGPVTKERFGGAISRSKAMTEVLASLEETGTVHFKIEGRRVVVMP